MSVQVNAESALREAVAGCVHDPLKFTIMAYPWGEGALASIKGPDKWQVEHLRALGESLRANPHKTIREAIGAAHGVGKSADASWLLQWAMSTFPDCRAVATAGTEDQLRTKLGPEFAFWASQLICRHWFTFGAETMCSVAPGHEKTWRLDFPALEREAPRGLRRFAQQG